MKLIKACAITSLLFSSCILATANAAPVTFNINQQFDAYYNNKDGNNFSHPNGGVLAGTLTIDASLTGNNRIVGYDLTSNLPGPGSRTSHYEFGATSNTFSFTSSILSLVTPISTVASQLLLDFGSSSLGGSTLAFTGSEKFFNCKGIFYGGYPKNSCTLGNFGVGIGTGVQGANLATAMTTSVSAVPVPAAVWLFGPAIAGFVGARKKVKNQSV